MNLNLGSTTHCIAHHSSPCPITAWDRGLRAACAQLTHLSHARALISQRFSAGSESFSGAGRLLSQFCGNLHLGAFVLPAGVASRDLRLMRSATLFQLTRVCFDFADRMLGFKHTYLYCTPSQLEEPQHAQRNCMITDT